VCFICFFVVLYDVSACIQTYVIAKNLDFKKENFDDSPPLQWCDIDGTIPSEMPALTCCASFVLCFICMYMIIHTVSICSQTYTTANCLDFKKNEGCETWARKWPHFITARLFKIDFLRCCTSLAVCFICFFVVLYDVSACIQTYVIAKNLDFKKENFDDSPPLQWCDIDGTIPSEMPALTCCASFVLCFICMYMIIHTVSICSQTYTTANCLDFKKNEGCETWARKWPHFITARLFKIDFLRCCTSLAVCFICFFVVLYDVSPCVRPFGLINCTCAIL